MFFIKHFLADFVFQDKKMSHSKKRYFYFNHSAIHGGLTALGLVFFTTIHTAIFFGMVDFLVHHNIDYLKTRLTHNLTHADRKYWIYFGLDQFLHYMTYAAILIFMLHYHFWTLWFA